MPDEKPTEDAGNQDAAPESVSPAQFKELLDKVASLEEHKARLNKENETRRQKERAAKEAAQAKEKTAADLAEEIRVRDAADALRDAGLKGNRAARLRAVRMLDSMDPEELEDAVERLKEEFPALFSEPKKEDTQTDDEYGEDERPTPQINKSANTNRSTVDTSMEGIADQLLGRKRRRAGVRRA